jgi:hypothetical protein
MKTHKAFVLPNPSAKYLQIAVSTMLPTTHRDVSFHLEHCRYGPTDLSTVITLTAPNAVVRRINDYLSRGPRYFGAGEPSDQKPTGMTIVTGSYRRKVDVAGERMGDPSKPAAHVEIWSYATNGIT